MPSTSSSALSSSISSRIVDSAVSEGKRWSRESMPASCDALCFAPTYVCDAGSSPTRMVARQTGCPHAPTSSATWARTFSARALPSIRTAVTRRTLLVTTSGAGSLAEEPAAQDLEVLQLEGGAAPGELRLRARDLSGGCGMRDVRRRCHAYALSGRSCTDRLRDCSLSRRCEQCSARHDDRDGALQAVGLDLGVVEETGDLVAVEAQSDVFITGHPEQLFHVRGGEVDLDTPRILVVADLEPERAGLAFGQSGL